VLGAVLQLAGARIISPEKPVPVPTSLETLYRASERPASIIAALSSCTPASAPRAARNVNGIGFNGKCVTLAGPRGGSNIIASLALE